MSPEALPDRSERERSIEKNVDGAMMLTFMAYLEPDKKLAQESIDVANKVFDACGYPRVPDVL